MISMRRVSLGAGYRYLMESIAVGDRRPEQSSSLTRYYAESGTPPGRFLGGGLAGLGDGQGVAVGEVVTEEHLYRMLGECADPISGAPLGRVPNRQPTTLAARVEDRLARLPVGISDADRAAVRAHIEAEEQARSHRLRPPVAGFDLTFSPSKSVSSAWGLADQGTKAIIYECHRRAIDYVLAYAEREVFHSRSGTNGIVQEDLDGVVAAAFTHYDSRAGDPQLHDHVVVMNRARSVSDGQWRTLDSRGLYKHVVTLSELHQGVLSDLLTGALGWGWDARSRRHSPRERWETVGVSDELLREFSQRVAQIETLKDDLIVRFTGQRGRAPTSNEVLELRRQATVRTRPDKQHRSLAEMTETWRQRAVPYVSDRPAAWVSTLADRNDLPLLRAADLDDDILTDAAGVAAQLTVERHSTFSRANILAEVHRQFHGVRFASPDDRMAVTERTADLALSQAVTVTAPESRYTPDRYRRADGTSRLHPKGYELFTTRALLDAETRLFAASRNINGPAVSVGAVAAMADKDLPNRTYSLSTDQAVAVEKIATSGRRLDVLVGPAGTGKSTTMAGLRAAWEAEHGAGSVIGLAPSAAAAEVLACELLVECENTAKWLHEHRQSTDRQAQLDQLRHLINNHPDRRPPANLTAQANQLGTLIERWALGAGQLVIVDEASLAGTFALDELVTAAGDAGAKVVLVGDPYQLSAIEAGGMFRSLVGDRADITPELSDVRRFAADWEKTASVQLRVGDEAAIDAYQVHDRVVAGGRDDLINAIYAAWKADVDAGRTSLMIAADAATVADLNRRARTDRITAGHAHAEGLDIAAEGTAGVGDLIVTRQNNRLLATGKRWVRNGDRFIVTATNHDGSMTVKRVDGIGEVVLPADYVTAHVELAYASSAHRTQGRTVDTCHALITPTTTREVLYVAATRGRQSNHLYVNTLYDPDPQTSHDGMLEPQTARDVLASVLAREGADLSAHATIRASHDAAEGMATLHAEYTTIATAAQEQRWDSLIEQAGLNDQQLAAVRASAAYGPLLAAFRDAEARGLNVEATFSALVAGRQLGDADDITSVLHGRVDRWIETAGSKRQAATNLIAGLISRAQGVTDPDLLCALHERDQAMEQRATTLAEEALRQLARWLLDLGVQPADPVLRAAWLHQVRIVAAYRDRWAVSGQAATGTPGRVSSLEQTGHYKQAHAALERARAISRWELEQHNRGRQIADAVTVGQKGVER